MRSFRSDLEEGNQGGRRMWSTVNLMEGTGIRAATLNQCLEEDVKREADLGVLSTPSDEEIPEGMVEVAMVHEAQVKSG